MIPEATRHPTRLCFDAVVTAVTPEGVTLSRTLFYPTGGGQPCDTGTLTASGETYQVTDVRKRDGAITHTLDRAGLNVGDAVSGRIDENRRSLHRRMHTAMHLVCAALEARAGTRITGNQIGEERSRLDVDLPEYDPAIIQEAIDAANAAIAKDLPVSRSVVSRTHILARPDLVKLAVGFPEHIQEIHLVEIPGVDAQACGGTHVDHLGEIGRIRLVKSENRGRSNRRVYLSLE